MKRIRVEINIPTVPERASLARTLQKKTGGWLFLDKEKKGCWWNIRRAWNAYDERTTHILVLEDDAIICNQFLEHVNKTVEVLSEHLIMYYQSPSTKQLLIAEQQCQEHDWHWYKIRGVNHGVATLMPVEMAKIFLNWDAEHAKQKDRHADDAHISNWQIKFGIPAYCSYPSLVQHPMHLKSTLSKGEDYVHTLNSTSFCFDVPAEIDWSSGADSQKIYHVSAHYKHL